MKPDEKGITHKHKNIDTESSLEARVRHTRLRAVYTKDILNLDNSVQSAH